MVPFARPLACAALILAAAPALAGKTAVSGIGGLPVFVPPLAAAAPAGATLATPAAVAAAIAAATDFCGRLPERAYVVDCLAERLAAIAQAMPASPDLAPARAELARAAADLSALARANADRSLPRARAAVPGGTRTTRPLVPVDRARQGDVAARAAAILERSETVLLRSPVAASRTVAVALASPKVLLRSA